MQSAGKKGAVFNRFSKKRKPAADTVLLAVATIHVQLSTGIVLPVQCPRFFESINTILTFVKNYQDECNRIIEDDQYG
jgi:hypothetical protein